MKKANTKGGKRKRGECRRRERKRGERRRHDKSRRERRRRWNKLGLSRSEEKKEKLRLRKGTMKK